MLDDEARKIDNVCQREATVRQHEIELKVAKQEIEADREKLLITIQANEKLKLQLREKEEVIEGELAQRVDKIMESERHSHNIEIKEIEREMIEVNRTLASLQIAHEK